MAWCAPINHTKRRREIKEGNLSARVNLDGKDEIAELAKTFDAMAESVESNQERASPYPTWRMSCARPHEFNRTVEAIMDGGVRGPMKSA